MADAFPQLNGTRVSKAIVTIPYSGIWSLDVSLDQQVTVTGGSAAFAIGALAMTGTIFRAGDFIGTGVFRIVGGAGGWQQYLPAQQFRGSGKSGLTISAVLNATAKAVGETVKIDTDASIGTTYIRVVGPAARTLNSLVGPQWWMGFDGVTHVGNRDTPIITSEFDVLPQGTNLGIGRIVIATESPEDWVPGALFSSPTLSQRSVRSVAHYVDPNKIRTVVWTQ